MSSRHLPAYVVAAFIKRVSRLSLAASPAGARLCIAFVCNLLNRFPVCLQLLNRPDNVDVGKSDPFVFEETDLKNSCALGSSLWELKALRSHYCPAVVELARQLDEPIAKRLYHLDEFLETSYWTVSLQYELGVDRNLLVP